MWPLLLIGAGIFFVVQQQKQSIPLTMPNGNAAKQPQTAPQQYPYQMPTVARADFANQPWAGNIQKVLQTGLQSPGNVSVANQQLNIGQVASTANQLLQTWSNLDLGSYFSSGSNSDAVDVAANDTASYPPVDYSGDSSGTSQYDGTTCA